MPPKIDLYSIIEATLNHHGLVKDKEHKALAGKVVALEKEIETLKKMVSQQPSTQTKKPTTNASDTVQQAIKNTGKKGADFKAIKEATGFNEKKVRNIITRLYDIGRIERPSRGIYTSH